MKAKTTKKTKTTKPAPDLAAVEKALAEKYPNSKIIKGSIRDVGTVKEFGNKRTVEIHCANHGCKATRRVATSDLYQVNMCTSCVTATRNARHQSKQKTKPAAKPKPAVKPLRTKTMKPAPKHKPAEVLDDIDRALAEVD